ncbi:MAG: hypothetical protein U0271_24855 [Polyangiaceae bacterium]
MKRERLLTPIRIVALVLAAMFAAVATVLSIVGMRSDVAFLSGGPSSDSGAACGLAYLFAWFGATLLAPPLVLFVLFDLAAERVPHLLRWIASSRRGPRSRCRDEPCRSRSSPRPSSPSSGATAAALARRSSRSR